MHPGSTPYDDKFSDASTMMKTSCSRALHSANKVVTSCGGAAGTYGSCICAIRQRLQDRKGHFMRSEMLDSQFDVLQEPHTAIIADITLSTQEIVAHITRELLIRMR